ncbi:hypothetical protein RFI_09992 [Reticulomyxa filosa]|uniref:2-oxoacid dehydrogenase acyltransferase catalytic domain-containing protein n=1 Tax=Reticulomyxa filosa TaxID=46433 RepID=X6NLH9_RETFI|nr:hypothetical protein RFI_09992 [Reticulomyxa filosa]|eukprot:ETO27140.1 hypothetical protein RFI_09992 [Reticulomyxa filosa]
MKLKQVDVYPPFAFDMEFEVSLNKCKNVTSKKEKKTHKTIKLTIETASSSSTKTQAKESEVASSKAKEGSSVRVEKGADAKKKVKESKGPSTDRSYVDIPMSDMRKIIAKRLSESTSTSPHYYVTVECQMDELLALRKQMNENEELKVSVNDFIIKAAAHAIRDVPDVNVSWIGDKLRKYNYVDISVAVATPTGLITPIVTDADARTVGNISSTVKELAARAKNNKLLPHEFQVLLFDINNLGMYGVSQFTAIINPPQSCIIAIGGANTVVKPDGKGGLKTTSTMLCTISSDHRTVDGALAAQYMAAFKKYIESPSKLLL